MSDQAENLRRGADILRRQGRFAEAAAGYRRIVALRPDLTDCWFNLGYSLKQAGEHEAALDAYEEALARGIERPEEARLNRAQIYIDHLRNDEAGEAELRAALSFKQDYAAALLNLGNLHEERGRREEAVACYEKIARQSGSSADAALRGEALARLAHLKTLTGPDDPLLLDLKTAAGAISSQAALTRANMLFALARAYDGLGRYDEAFDAFREANREARRTGPAYDPRRMERYVDALIAGFSSVSPPQNESSATDTAGPAPIFICGMFRSGSTLIEQIVSGHDFVTAGGELNILHKMAAGPLAPFPASVASAAPEKLSALAQDYRRQVAALFPQADQPGRYVTDKRPDNFLLIGLIKRLFPQSKIIHTVRHPLDTCLSIYFQHLDQRFAGYSSDLGDIAHYYGQYRRLMAHWKMLFPESIHDIGYDRFVREPAAVLAPLFAFLGLDWDERLLSFHERKNSVKTASYWQVRKPLYAGSSGRWRHYEAHLGGLAADLSAQGFPPDRGW